MVVLAKRPLCNCISSEQLVQRPCIKSNQKTIKNGQTLVKLSNNIRKKQQFGDLTHNASQANRSAIFTICGTRSNKNKKINSYNSKWLSGWGSHVQMWLCGGSWPVEGIRGNGGSFAISWSIVHPCVWGKNLGFKLYHLPLKQHAI